MVRWTTLLPFPLMFLFGIILLGLMISHIQKGGKVARAPHSPLFTTNPVKLACNQSIGESDGKWVGPYWSPSCGSFDFVLDSQLVENSRAQHPTKFFMMGDSVLRDTTIALQNMYSSGSPALTQADGKRNCMKHFGRNFSCFINFGGPNVTSEFVWFQWYNLPHRLHNTTFEKAQEEDICSVEYSSSSSMKECLHKVLGASTAHDVLVFRTGLNYLLYEHELRNWEESFTEDLTSLLHTLPSVFTGKVIFLLLSPLLEEAQAPAVCSGRGFWDRSFWTMNPKIKILNELTQRLVKPLGYPVIDPWRYTTENMMKAHYKDCVHPALPGPIPNATANLLLNLVFSSEIYQSRGIDNQGPTLATRDGSNGVVYCNCNVGNFNNQLITCKICAALAYYSNRKMILLPWCEDNGTNATRDCAEVHHLFSMDTLSLLVPTQSWPIGEKQLPCTEWLRDIMDISGSLTSNAKLPSSLCFHPSWMHRVDDTCAHNLSLALQVNFADFVLVSKFWVPAARIMTSVEKIIAHIPGPYMSLHLRRAQYWLPSEMRDWNSGGWPDVSLSMEEIIEILRYASHVHHLAPRGGLFLATNSQNATELSLLRNFCQQQNYQLFTAEEFIGNATFLERIAVDLALLCRGSVFVGTPGSTFTANVRHYHLSHYGNDEKVRTLCQLHRGMKKTKYSAHFNDTVLAISFSWPYYESIPLLKWMYQVFPIIYFCGPPSAALGDSRYREDINVVSLGSGWSQHRCLLSAIEKYPGKRGYFGSNDDLILNWWRLAQFDLDKVWLEPCKRWANITTTGLVRNDFDPSSLLDGLGDPYPQGKAALLKAYLNTTPEYQKRLSIYTGGRDIYCEGDPDFIYLPQKVASTFKEVVRPFDDVDVAFIYIYHSVVRGIVSDENIIKPKGVWMWGNEQRANFAVLYGENATLAHPLKLSHAAMREVVVAAFQKNLPGHPPD